MSVSGIISASALPPQLLSHFMFFIFLAPSSLTPSLPPSLPALSDRCVCRALSPCTLQRLVLWVNYIAFLKIEQAATLRAIFLLGRRRRRRTKKRGGTWPKAHFMLKISRELRRQKTTTGVQAALYLCEMGTCCSHSHSVPQPYSAVCFIFRLFSQ